MSHSTSLKLPQSGPQLGRPLDGPLHRRMVDHEQKAHPAHLNQAQMPQLCKLPLVHLQSRARSSENLLCLHQQCAMEAPFCSGWLHQASHCDSRFSHPFLQASAMTSHASRNPKPYTFPGSESFLDLGKSGSISVPLTVIPSTDGSLQALLSGPLLWRTHSTVHCDLNSDPFFHSRFLHVRPSRMYLLERAHAYRRFLKTYHCEEKKNIQASRVLQGAAPSPVGC